MGPRSRKKDSRLLRAARLHGRDWKGGCTRSTFRSRTEAIHAQHGIINVGYWIPLESDREPGISAAKHDASYQGCEISKNACKIAIRHAQEIPAMFSYSPASGVGYCVIKESIPATRGVSYEDTAPA